MSGPMSGPISGSDPMPGAAGRTRRPSATCARQRPPRTVVGTLLVAVLTGVSASLVVGAFGLLPVPAQAAPAQEITPAERALFLEPSLGGLKAGTALDYRMRRSGTLDSPFDDDARLTLTPRADQACCAAQVRFLSGERTVKLPDIDLPEANPVLLGFLEYDIREMERATGGKANYFRKRIRMALAEGPALQPVTLRWKGQPLPAVAVTIQPYADDPLRARYGKLADKRYTFWRATGLPGRLAGVRTQVIEPGTTALLATTELWLQGLELPATTP